MCSSCLEVSFLQGIKIGDKEAKLVIFADDLIAFRRHLIKVKRSLWFNVAIYFTYDINFENN